MSYICTFLSGAMTAFAGYRFTNQNLTNQDLKLGAVFAGLAIIMLITAALAHINTHKSVA